MDNLGGMASRLQRHHSNLGQLLSLTASVSLYWQEQRKG